MDSLLSPLSTNDLFMTQEAGVILLKHVNPFQLCHSFSLYRPMAFPFHSELIQISYSGLGLALDLVFCSLLLSYYYQPCCLHFSPIGILALIGTHHTGVLYLTSRCMEQPVILSALCCTSCRSLLNSRDR